MLLEKSLRPPMIQAEKVYEKMQDTTYDKCYFVLYNAHHKTPSQLMVQRASLRRTATDTAAMGNRIPAATLFRKASAMTYREKDSNAGLEQTNKRLQATFVLLAFFLL